MDYEARNSKGFVRVNLFHGLEFASNALRDHCDNYCVNSLLINSGKGTICSYT